MEEDKAFKSITFSGKKEDYMMWSAKFLSYAQVKGFKKVLMGTESPPASNYLSPDADQKRISKANDVAYSMLNIAVKDDVSFGAIYTATTDELPDGDAHKAWENLKQIFKPVSNANKHELEQSFNQCCLIKDDKNPDEWFAELERIRLQLKLDHKENYTDEKMISQIVYNLVPNMYKMTITLLKRDLNRGLTLKLSEVQDDIRQIYAQSKSTQKSTSKGESVLAAHQKYTKGDCRNCGKKGHKASDCWELDKNKSRRPANYKARESAAFLSTQANSAGGGKTYPPCGYCKKIGHSEDRCFKKQNDARKSGTTESTEKATTTTAKVPLLICIGKGNTEALMQNTTGDYEFTDNTFIADSGATSHMRYSKIGMTDLIPY